MRLLDSWRLGSVARAAATAVLVTTAACGGPSVADIENQAVTLQVTGVYLGDQAVPSGDERGDFTISRALISVDSLTLTPCADSSAAITLDPRVYDLTADPPQGERVTTAVTEFCTLRVDLAPSPDITEHSSKSPESLLVEVEDETSAKTTYAAEDSPSVTFSVDGDATFGDQPLLLGFDLSTWLTYVAGSATDELPGLAPELSDVAALYVDSNGNDRLDEDEQTPVAHATVTR